MIYNGNDINIRKKHRRHFLAPAALLTASLAVSPLLIPLPASADELSDTIDETNKLVDDIESISDELDESKSKIEELNGKISDGQEQQAALQEYLSKHVRESYKSGGSMSLVAMALSSDSISQFLEMAKYAETISSMYDNAIDEQKSEQERLSSEYSEIVAEKDEQEKKLDELQAKKKELSEKVTKLKKEKAEAAQKAAAAAETASETASSTASTFATGDTSGWLSGTASAYGGSSDPGCGTRTATGATVSDYSMGVAVPMSMPNYRSYLGRQVEISYGGKSVIATVNDCGGMGGGSRVLDLQPGVFKALGASTCNAWGLRTVKYRFL